MLSRIAHSVRFNDRGRAVTTALVLAGLAFSSTAALNVPLSRGVEPKQAPVAEQASYVAHAPAELATISDLVPAPVVTPAAPTRSHWDDLADCESGEWGRGGQPIVGTATWTSTAGYFEGGLQFAPPTWDGFRDDHMPAHAHEASREVQIEVAERVLDKQGWGAWPVCSRKVGLR